MYHVAQRQGGRGCHSSNAPLKPLWRSPFGAPIKLPPVSFWWWVWWELGHDKCPSCIAVHRGTSQCTAGVGGVPSFDMTHL